MQGVSYGNVFLQIPIAIVFTENISLIVKIYLSM